MTFKEYLKKRGFTGYRLSKESGVPYTVTNELMNEKKQLENCSVHTVLRIARVLGVSIEDLLQICSGIMEE